MNKIVLFFALVFFGAVSIGFSQIQTNALKKAIRWEKKNVYLHLSDEDGYFLFPHFGMRYGKNPDPFFTGLQDLSIYYGMGLGYRKQNLSLESGLSIYHHTSSAVYFPIWERPEFVMNSDLASMVLPFTFRYDIPTGDQQNIRLGAFLTANWAFISLEEDGDSREGKLKGDDGEVNYTLYSEPKSPFFFKTGVHSKIRLLNSSFLNLEFGHFFSLGSNRLYTLRLSDKPAKEILRKWEGLTWSVGMVLTMRVLEEKFRKSE